MICVTGGSGFIGAALSKALIQAGERVRIFDLMEPEGALKSKAEFLKGDIRNAPAVGEALRGCDMVYHIAGLVPISRAKKDFYDVNVLGTRNILEAAEKNKTRRVIYYSTGHAVYGIGTKMPMHEDDEKHPFTDYGKSKFQAEELCRAFRANGLNISIVRPATVVGPGRLGTFKLLFDWISAGKNVYLIGNGRNRVQYVSIRDMVEASLLLGQRGGFSDYNIGTDRFSTLSDLISGLIRHAGSRSKIVCVPAVVARLGLGLLDFLRLSPFVGLHYRTFHLDAYYDITKAKTELLWQPQDSNDKMFQSAYDWYISAAGKEQGGALHQRGVKKGILKLLDYLP